MKTCFSNVSKKYLEIQVFLITCIEFANSKWYSTYVLSIPEVFGRVGTGDGA